jgi:hypothetical protein
VQQLVEPHTKYWMVLRTARMFVTHCAAVVAQPMMQV